MTKTAPPKLLISISSTPISESLFKVLLRDCEEIHSTINHNRVFMAIPVFDEVEEILQECTADKFLFLLASLAMYLSPDQFTFCITNTAQLYSPKSEVYYKYIRISNISGKSDSSLTDQLPQL
jgi:hypothetical protein